MLQNIIFMRNLIVFLLATKYFGSCSVEEKERAFESKRLACFLGETKAAEDNWPLDWFWASEVILVNGKI